MGNNEFSVKNEVSEKEVSEKEVSEKEVSENEVSENEVSENEVSDDYDFTNEILESLYQPKTETYDPAPDREKVRGRMAQWVLLLLVAVVLLSFISIVCNWTTFDNLKKLLDIFLTPLVGLVSSIIGFYYGEKSR
jgi:hypothetical protein